jgi:hypothetical protein
MEATNQQLEVKHMNAALQLESPAAESNNQQLEVKHLKAALPSLNHRS